MNAFNRDAGLSASTVRTISTVLRAALDIASRDGLIRSTPAAAVRRPGVEGKDAPHLTAEQAQALLEAIRAHRTRQLEDQRTAAGAWQEHGLVFTTEIGTPLEPRTVLRPFEVLAQRTGLRRVTLHTLRHSAASFLLAAGTHTKVVREHLGQSSYAITADIYSHVGPAQQREAAERLDQALRW